MQEYNYHTRVMGCDFDMSFVTESERDADRYFAKSLVLAREYEKRFSRFDNESELSKLNTQKEMRVSEDFLRVWNEALRLYKETSHLFNPLAQVEQIGYNKSFDDLEQEQCIDCMSEKYDIDMDAVIQENGKIILKQNQRLDFGGFLKGYVAQKIVESLDEIKGAVINIGGDMYIKGVGADGKKFEIEILNPINETKNISVTLQDKSLCTSGIYKRKWLQQNKQKHHILNVSNRDSAKSDLLSASIICKNGALADALATSAIVLGSKKAKCFLNELSDVEYVLINKRGDIIKSDGCLN